MCGLTSFVLQQFFLRFLNGFCTLIPVRQLSMGMSEYLKFDLTIQVSTAPGKNALSCVASNVTPSAVHRLPRMRICIEGSFLEEILSRLLHVAYASEASECGVNIPPETQSGGQRVVQKGH